MDTETIKNVKNSVTVPVVANGGVYTADDALRLIEATGCDGIAVGQGAMGNPFLFSEIASAFKNQPFIAPATDEILKIASEHVHLLCMDKGEYIGVREARKHLGWYIKGMPGAAEARRSINSATTEAELGEILDAIARVN